MIFHIINICRIFLYNKDQNKTTFYFAASYNTDNDMITKNCRIPNALLKPSIRLLQLFHRFQYDYNFAIQLCNLFPKFSPFPFTTLILSIPLDDKMITISIFIGPYKYTAEKIWKLR